MRHTVPGHACRGRIAAFAAAIMRGPVELIRTTPSRRDCSFVRATVSRWRSAAVVAIAAKFTAPLSAPGGREARPDEGRGSAVMHGSASRVLRDDSSKLYDSMRKFGGH